MMRFSAEQMTQLEDDVFHKFIERVVAHLREYAPELCARRPHPVLYRAARQACDKGRDRGIEEERGLILFSSLSIMLGAGFDTDPAIPWVGSILEDPAYLAPGERMHDLWDMAMTYLDEIYEEPEAVVSHRALSRYHEWLSGRVDTGGDVVDLMARLWPEKADAVGHEALTALAGQATGLAADYGFTDGGQIRRFAVLACFLGHRFDIDPLHDWAGATLRDAHAWTVPGQAIQRLEQGFAETIIVPVLGIRDLADAG